MSAQAGGVLATMDRQIETARALSADAFHAQELPKLVEARATVAELIDGMSDLLFALRQQPTTVTRMLPMQHAIAALARAGGAQ